MFSTPQRTFCSIPASAGRQPGRTERGDRPEPSRGCSGLSTSRSRSERSRRRGSCGERRGHARKGRREWNQSSDG
ncbi:hypothetical protein [Klebsiella phage vB_KshKPC-M]|nr:hypothetical protein [Klebsiella phage vB_KshKPC-M]